MIGYQRWYLTFFVSFIMTLLLFMSFNYVIDPFGIFGDQFLNMQSYNMSQNGRTAKISYLDRNYEKFDSYVIGGSKSGALQPKMLERYYPGSHFYNLNYLSGRFYDYELTIQYIVNHYHVKNILLQISQLEANKPGTLKALPDAVHGKLTSEFPFFFYMKAAFQNPNYGYRKLKKAKDRTTESNPDYFYNIETGSYNYDVAENRMKRDPDGYFNDKTLFPGKNPTVTHTVYDDNLEILKRIVNFCKQNGVNLLLITSPTYEAELVSYPQDQLGNFLKKIASVHPYWNFSGYNSISLDQTNFYNNNHFRLNIAEKMLARIFNDPSVFVPSDFGEYVTAENSEKIIDTVLTRKK